MWYVMQVTSGREGQTILMMEKSLPEGILEKCFIPVRRMKKKYQGRWHEITEKLFPGYVFLITEKPRLLYGELKKLPAMTKLLGSCEEYFSPLSQTDMDFLGKFQDLQDGVGLSRVAVGEKRQIRIIAGPLKNLEGQIKKVNLHKRTAVVEAEFMGNKSLLHLGIEIVDKRF